MQGTPVQPSVSPAAEAAGEVDVVDVGRVQAQLAQQDALAFGHGRPQRLLQGIEIPLEGIRRQDDAHAGRHAAG